MRLDHWILGLSLLAGCTNQATTNNPVKPEANGAHEATTNNPLTPEPDSANETLPSAVEFFTDWFESHGHTEVVVDADGVGVGANATRLSASLYGSNQNDEGTFVVETEFRIRLPSGREIVEYVAGIGDTQEQAVKDTMLNFTLTTFHVIYKGFINADDPHMTTKQLDINGRKREAIFGDIYLRGGAENEQVDLNSMRPEIEAAIAATRLTQGEHWIKIVYGQSNGEPVTVSATTDNEVDQALTETITHLEWPRSTEFYMAKQFIVVK